MRNAHDEQLARSITDCSVIHSIINNCSANCASRFALRGGSRAKKRAPRNGSTLDERRTFEVFEHDRKMTEE